MWRRLQSDSAHPDGEEVDGALAGVAKELRGSCMSAVRTQATSGIAKELDFPINREMLSSWKLEQIAEEGIFHYYSVNIIEHVWPHAQPIEWATSAMGLIAASRRKRRS